MGVLSLEVFPLTFLTSEVFFMICNGMSYSHHVIEDEYSVIEKTSVVKGKEK